MKRHSKRICSMIEKNKYHKPLTPKVIPAWILCRKDTIFSSGMVVSLHTRLVITLFAAASLNIKCAVHPSPSSPYQSYTITLTVTFFLKANQCELPISQIRSSTQVQMSWPLITHHHWPKFETTRSHFSWSWHPERHHLSGHLPCIFFFFSIVSLN